MNLEKVNKLLMDHEKLGGNLAVMYPLLKDRIDGIYEDTEVPFKEEFLFFENKYLEIKKHMLENGITGDILDIGCQFGFQSELFLDCNSYTGVDVAKHRFFNQDKEHVQYIIGNFPNNVTLPLEDSVVCSVMSIGYFNNYIHPDNEVALARIVEQYKKIKHLYISTTEELVEQLEPHFSIKECLLESRAGHSRFNVYYMGK